MTLNIQLKRAALDDVATYQALEKSVAGLKTYSALLEEQEIIDEITNKIVYLIKDGDETLGSISYEMKSEEHAYIDGLLIDPKFQGKGVARKAMEVILEELKKIKRIDLVTHPRNTPAIRLYLSLGFVIESWKDNYFGDGEPRISMAFIKN
jgi:ribosomal protein S18 acetylase RimI-like enzyme